MEYNMDKMGDNPGSSSKSVSHPIESMQGNYKKRKEDENLKLASKTFGIGFSLHLKHERAAVQCPSIGHLPFLKRHNAMQQSLMGEDVEFDFSDILASEPEFNINTNKAMDDMSKKSLFIQ